MALPLSPHISQGSLSQDNDLSRDGHSENAKPSLKNSCYNDLANILVDWKIKCADPVVLLTDYAISNDITANHSMNLKIERMEPTPFLTNSSGVNSSIVSAIIAGDWKIKYAEPRVVLEDVDEHIERMLIEFPINFIDEVLSMSSFKLDEEVGKVNLMRNHKEKSVKQESSITCPQNFDCDAIGQYFYLDLSATDTSSSKPWKCSTCDHRSNRRFSIKLHFARKHGVQSVKADPSDALSQSLIHDIKEMNDDVKQNELVTFKCQFCAKICKLRGDLKTHLVGRHSRLDAEHLIQSWFQEELAKARDAEGKNVSDKDQIKLFKCFYCDFRANRRCFVEKHTSEVHKINSINENNIDENSDKPQVEGEHSLSQKSNDKSEIIISRPFTSSVDKGEKPFKCSLCDYRTSRLFNLKKHGKSHTQPQIDCPHCGLSYSQYLFVRHLKRRHPEIVALNQKSKKTQKPISLDCPECDFVGETRLKLKSHYKYRHSPKIYMCHKCDYRCRTKFALESHFISHQVEKPFKCDKCPFAGKTKSHLAKHRGVHLTERPFKCDRCSYTAQTRRNLNNHLYCHGDYKYRCKECGKLFKRPLLLYLHKKRFHKVLSIMRLQHQNKNMFLGSCLPSQK